MTTNPKTLAAITRQTTRTARLATIKTTLHELANIEASLRSEARTKYQVGLDPTHLLKEAAFIEETYNGLSIII